MRYLSLFLYEWKHFIRSPFKVVALVLFVLAAGYGLHNGANLYHKQLTALEQIEETIAQDRAKYIAYYDEGKPGPENAPWIDIRTPFWAVWFSYSYHVKTPSPALVYSMGQAEAYGFYKRVTFWASPYDADMTQEIANPERLQTGTLDFAFALLFLLPLLLLIFLYNLKSTEAEQGFLPLIQVQTRSINAWLLSRVSFYVALIAVVLTLLLIYGAWLSDVFASHGTAFGQMCLYSLLYLLFWASIYFFILRSGTQVMSNTLKMAGIWLVVAFIIPASVAQWVSIRKPANLMMELIDANREDTQALYDLPDSVFNARLEELFPQIEESPVAKDSTQRKQAYSSSASALVNELVKNSILPIEADNHAKNQMIRNSYLFNPLSFFQNRLNRISQTHFDDYQQYRDEIQFLIDKQIRIMVLDTWMGKEIDKQTYFEYHQQLTNLKTL